MIPTSDRLNETYNEVSQREVAGNTRGGWRQISLVAIRPNPHNARTHSARQIRQIANSIAAFGFTNPLLVDEDLNIIAGHGRYAAAQSLGMSEIPVIVLSGLSVAKRRALAIADNRIPEGGKWDRRRLAIEIPELTELLSLEQLDISILGFEPIEIEQIRLEPEAPTRLSHEEARSHHDIDPAWGEGAAVSRSGDLWILNTHKLLCGDDRSADDLNLVMGADRADMAFIDLGDAKRGNDAEGGVKRTLDAAAAVSREGALHFLCTNWAGVGHLAATAKKAGWRVLDVVVWVPPDPSQGTMYRDQYEPIAVLEIGSSESLRETQERRARLAPSNVWRYPRSMSLPLTFADAVCRSARLVPVALVADAIKDCTHRKDVILDPFSGAGVTIMAAQRLGRRARCIEREPRLVDVTIRRWQAATGRQALHAESCLPFNAVEAKRDQQRNGWER